MTANYLSAIMCMTLQHVNEPSCVEMAHEFALHIVTDSREKINASYGLMFLHYRIDRKERNSSPDISE